MSSGPQKGYWQTSADPDQKRQNVAYDKGLHCKDFKGNGRIHSEELTEYLAPSEKGSVLKVKSLLSLGQNLLPLQRILSFSNRPKGSKFFHLRINLFRRRVRCWKQNGVTKVVSPVKMATAPPYPPPPQLSSLLILLKSIILQ